MLECHSVSREFDGKILWERVSLLAPPGKLITVSGPNGSGKTTLLRVCAGLTSPTTGTVTYRGKDIAKNWSDLRAVTGTCFYPERSLYLRLTGRQNLNFFGGLQGIESRSLNRRLAELDATFKVEEFLRYRVQTLSLGQRRIAAITIACLIAKEYVFLDEPTATLDDNNSAAVREVISHLVGQGRTVLATSHDPKLLSMADTQIVLEHSHVRAKKE